MDWFTDNINQIYNRSPRSQNLKTVVIMNVTKDISQMQIRKYGE